MCHLFKCRSYATVTVLLSCVLSGCASYDGVVRPAPRLNVLSPELQNLTDAAIEVYLKADVKPAFPTVLAVARLVPQGRGYYRHSRYVRPDTSRLQLDTVRGPTTKRYQDEFLESEKIILIPFARCAPHGAGSQPGNQESRRGQDSARPARTTASSAPAPPIGPCRAFSNAVFDHR